MPGFSSHISRNHSSSWYLDVAAIANFNVPAAVSALFHSRCPCGLCYRDPCGGGIHSNDEGDEGSRTRVRLVIIC